jgi:homoserine O-acetyltransferase
MDSHHVGRNRGTVLEALDRIKARTHVISLKTDLLFPQKEQEFLAENIPDADFHSIPSVYGHDGFLLEYEAISSIIRDFISVQDPSPQSSYPQTNPI